MTVHRWDPQPFAGAGPSGGTVSFALLLLLLSTAPARAQDGRFGIVYDPAPGDAAQVDGDMKSIAAMGMTWIRLLPDWTVQQPAADRFDWTWSDALVKAARNNHLQVVYTLGYTPRWASQYATETDTEVWNHNRPQGVESWQKYVTAVARRYSHDVSIWQVWERPDIYRFRGSDKDLRELLLAASRSIHGVSPDARLLCPEVGQVNLGNINRMYEHGLAAGFDILGVYPDLAEPEAEVRPLTTLKERIVDKKGPAKVLWVDALSWNVAAVPGPASPTVVSDQDQARYAVRSTVLALAHNVQTVLWRAWRDRTEGPPAVQNRSGLEAADGSERPVAAAWRTLIATLGNRPFVRMVPTDAHTYVYQFEGLDVAWTDGPQVPLTLPAGVTARSTAGAVLPALTLSADPVYLTGPVEGLVFPSRGVGPADYSSAADVHVQLADPPVEKGLYVHRYGPVAVPDTQGGQACWRTDLANHKTQMFFDIDDSYLYFVDGRYAVDIDVEAWAGTPKTGFNIGYDGDGGYSFTPWQWLDAGTGWQHYHFHLTDAVLADPYADFRINALGSKGDIYVRSVTVTRSPR